ncbi:MAG: ribonuclease D [Actinobacteria bacterium]|nr:MAG: ribonuclease D [Actinomycetota bacterium]
MRITHQPTGVDSRAVVAEIAEQARGAGRLAIDTEFMSERRYRAMLCLAQVAVPDETADGGVRTEVLDPLADDAPDPAPLAAALADPAVEVIVHAGRQDVAILRRTWRTDVTNVFDTQVAAGFVGFGTQEGYKQLVRKVLGTSLPGGEAFTQWDRRPLTPEQLEYARGDPRVDRLKPAQRAVARELVEWREGAAREADRAATSLLPDHVLVELARRRPDSRDELDSIRGLPEATLHRRHRELLEAIERGREREAPPPAEGGVAPHPDDAPLVALAQALVRHRSQASGVAAQLIATSPELTRLVADVRRGGSPELPVLRGWRRELVGAELLDLLAGRLTLGVGSDRRLAVRES